MKRSSLRCLCLCLWVSCRALFFFLCALSLSTSGCTDPAPDGRIDGGGPCPCAVGSKRCSGAGVQVCEESAPGCGAWGPTVLCPRGACDNGSCPGNCMDQCPAGTTRCADEIVQEVCRISPVSGCLEWARQACESLRYCAERQCRAAMACDPECPASYMCRPTGVCAGGNPAELTLDTRGVRLTGQITVAGAAPIVDSAACSATRDPGGTKLGLAFTDKARGYRRVLTLPCQRDGASFDTLLFPGTYEVRVYNPNGYVTNIPTESTAEEGFLVSPALALSADLLDQGLDIKAVRVSGRVTVAGAAPVVDSTACSGTRDPGGTKLGLAFVEKTLGYRRTLTLPCQRDGAPFDILLFPGTYEVRAYNPNGYVTNMPLESTAEEGFLVNPGLVLAADLADQVLDVRAVRLTGRVTVAGMAPVVDSAACSATRDPSGTKLGLVFTDTDKGRGYRRILTLPCQRDGASFDTLLFPGTYEVRVYNPNGYVTNLPLESTVEEGFLASPSLDLSTSQSNRVLDVKAVRVRGQVTVNGAAPVVDSAACSATRDPGGTKLGLLFSDKAQGYRRVLTLPCQRDGAPFDVLLFPGTYEVRVYNPNGYVTNLPTESTAEEGFRSATLSLLGDATGQVLDVRGVRLSGRVTVGGAAPVVDPNACSATRDPGGSKLGLLFTDKVHGYRRIVTLPCQRDGAPFDVLLFPGTYEVRVYNPSGYVTNLPPESTAEEGFLSLDALTLMTDAADRVFDARAVRVAGRVTVRGGPLTVDSTVCGAARDPGGTKFAMQFTDRTSGYRRVLTLPCKQDGAPFDALLFPGTYEVRVYNPNGYVTNLPLESTSDEGYVAVRALAVP